MRQPREPGGKGVAVKKDKAIIEAKEVGREALVAALLSFGSVIVKAAMRYIGRHQQIISEDRSKAGSQASSGRRRNGPSSKKPES